MPPHVVRFEPSRSHQEALERAAALWGIEPEYRDVWRKQHLTPPEVQRAVLESLGVACDTLDEIDRAIEERLWREWSRLVPPCLVMSENADPPAIPLHIPARLAGRTALIRLRWEDGATQRIDCRLEELPDSAGAEIRGKSFVRKMVPVPLRLGYHTVEVSLPFVERQTLRLIVAPDRVYQHPALEGDRRAAGLAVSLYGLRSSRNWGCGDFTDLENLAGWVADELHASFISLNPLHAIHNRQPYNTSPYLPNCAFYRNFIYLDIERIEEFANCPRARRLLASSEVQAEIEALRAAEFVEYERVHALKLRFLRLLFDRPLEEQRRRQFEDYVRDEGELLDRHAVYCALDEWIHSRHPEIWIWPDWPAEFRDPDSPAVRSFARRRQRSVLFYKYIQWQIELQLQAVQLHGLERGLSIGLYHDLALATDRCGADLWAHRRFYAAGCRVGAPPDDFSPQGQDWSFPPPNSERHREDGYRLFTESIRRNTRHGGALRIDHVMRCFRLYWIPDGMPATHGAYVRDRYEDLLRILALESVRQKVILIGEDLGTVAGEVRETLARFGILGCRLLYFERDSMGRFRLPEEYPRAALVSATTHDLPTLAGFWMNRDIEVRRAAGLLAGEAACRALLAERARDKQALLDLLFRLGLLPDYVPRSAAELPELTGELHNAVVGFLVSTPSALMVLNQEDLFKETEQQNLPGATHQYPNWRHKMRFTLEALRSEPAARDFTAMFRNWLQRSGRSPT